jgi:hypothetical protein
MFFSRLINTAERGLYFGRSTFAGTNAETFRFHRLAPILWFRPRIQNNPCYQTHPQSLRLVFTHDNGMVSRGAGSQPAASLIRGGWRERKSTSIWGLKACINSATRSRNLDGRSSGKFDTSNWSSYTVYKSKLLCFDLTYYKIDVIIYLTSFILNYKPLCILLCI